MSENRFLSSVLTEGILSIIFGWCILVLPKLTDVSFGFTLCISFILYGGYKAIMSFISRNFERCFVLSIISSLILFLTGLFVFFAQVIDMTLIAAVLGIYFILESIIASGFAMQTETLFKTIRSGLFIAVVRLFFGIVLVVALPSLWVSGVLASLNFLLSGIFLINMFLIKKIS